jgi:hypothetical protein
MATVCVEVVARRGLGLADAVASLDRQEPPPQRIRLVAAPTVPKELLQEVRTRTIHVPVEVVPDGAPGAGAGDRSLPTEEVTVFFDGGGIAPPGWLSCLVAPLAGGTAAHSAGPIRPLSETGPSGGRAVVLFEASIYEGLVPERPEYFPLHNTAWRTSVLRDLGVDERMPTGTDDDLEARAVRAGLIGVFVPAAWVYCAKSEATRRRPGKR